MARAQIDLDVAASAAVSPRYAAELTSAFAALCLRMSLISELVTPVVHRRSQFLGCRVVSKAKAPIALPMQKPDTLAGTAKVRRLLRRG